MHLTFVFPRLKTFSGAENLLLQLTRFAAEAGHDVVVVTRRVDEACQPLFDPRVEIRLPARPFRWLSGVHLVDSLFDTLWSPALIPRLPSHTDVLCFFCSPTLPVMAWAHRRSSAAVAYYCLQPPRFAYDLQHEATQGNGLLGRLVPWLAPLYRRLDRALAPRCDRLLAISEDYAEWCRELYDPPAVELVYPGIDPGLADAADPERIRRRLGVADDTPLVATINKLIPRKNVDVFLRAMARVIERMPSARGVVVGNGPSRRALERLRDELGLADKVLFTGYVEEFSDVISHYAASDVYVFLEKNVPFGLTVLEAGACGRAVVAVRGGGTRDTVRDGETGYLVDDRPIDVEEVAEKIHRLLADDELRRSMGERGRENAQRFSHAATAARFVDTLVAMADGRRAEGAA